MTICPIWKVRVPAKKPFIILLPTPEISQVRAVAAYLDGIADEPELLSDSEAWFQWLQARRPNKLAKEEFYGRLARQLDAGVPITAALASQGRENRNMHLRRVALDIILLLNEGKEVVAAFTAHPEVFSTEELAVIAAGVRAGNQCAAFSALEKQNRSDREIGSALIQAAIYPTMSMTLAYAAIMVFSFKLIPSLKGPFQKIRSLPLITKVEIAMSDFFVAFPWAAVAIPAAFIAVFVFREKLKLGTFFATVAASIPVIGKFVRKGRIARLAQTMAMLKEAGVPELEMLSHCRNVSPDSAMQAAIDEMREQLAEGKPIEEACIALVGMVGDDAVELLQAMQAGARSGDVRTELTYLASRLEKDFMAMAMTISKPIELLLTVCVALVIGSMAYGIFIPLFDLGEAMSQ